MRARYMRWATQTTKEVLDELTDNKELIGVLAGQWGDYGLPPGKSNFAVHATIAEHYFNGTSYPVGGAGSIAAAMVPRIEDAGGAVVTSAEVVDILLEGARAAGVRMSDGREFRSGIVVSDVGAINTFGRLLPPGLAAIVEALRQVGARFQSISEPWADTTTHAGKMIMTIFTGIAEFERDLIRERTSAGRADARERRVQELVGAKTYGNNGRGIQ